VIDTIAETLHYLYEGFEVAEKGEDHGLSMGRGDVALAESAARYWGEVNDSRQTTGTTEWDSILVEAVFKARAEQDPQAKTDRLLELAAVALTCAGSVQRQTDAFNAEPEVKRRKKVEDGE